MGKRKEKYIRGGKNRRKVNNKEKLGIKLFGREEIK